MQKALFKAIQEGRPLPSGHRVESASSRIMLRRWLLVGLVAAPGLLTCNSTPRKITAAQVKQRHVQTEEVDLSAFFVDLEGTFVVYEPERALRRVYNPNRAERRFIPASTFKIPNSLIALDSRIASGEEFAIAWDSLAVPPERWWPRSWRRDQTLQSAFQNSVYWFYQEMARCVGQKRMQTYLRRFHYGNQNMHGGLDKFWLYGDLRISPYEQVEFLERFYEGDLGVSKHATDTVKSIMLIDATESVRLSGKTGTADVTPTRELGWIVGFVEVQGKVAFYALNMEGERVWEDWPPHQRIVLVRRLLSELGMM